MNYRYGPGQVKKKLAPATNRLLWKLYAGKRKGMVGMSVDNTGIPIHPLKNLDIFSTGPIILRGTLKPLFVLRPLLIMRYAVLYT